MAFAVNTDEPCANRPSAGVSSTPASSAFPSLHSAFSAGPPPIPDHELLRCIGHGSFGEVWLARTIMGTYRAAKIVYRHAFDHPRPYEREFEGIRRFEPVSRRHESQLPVLQVGRNDEAGYFYYVMELADDAGVSRADRPSGAAMSPTPSASPGLIQPESYVPRTLKHELHQRGRLPVDECLRIGLSLTTALAHLHGHGLIHRDIKPSNIVFIEGIPKLADLGLIATLDASMSISGTPGYIPPEGSGTPQADIYSLGKVLYEMSMGRDRSEFPKLPADFASLPERQLLLELNAVLVKAGQANPAQRYQAAAEMHADLALIRSGKSVKRLHRLELHLVLARRIAFSVLAISVLIAGAWWQTWRAQRIANQHLTRLHEKEGAHQIMQGNYAAALPWLVGAFQMDPDAAQNEALHRMRIATVLRQCPRPVGVFSEPDAKILDADVNRDGTLLATAHEDDRVRLWDLETGTLVRTLPHSFPVHFCRFLPQGNRLLTATFDQKCSMWDLRAERANPLTWAHNLQTGAGYGYEFGFNLRTHQAFLSKMAFKVARYHPFTNQLERLKLCLTVTAENESIRFRILAQDLAPNGKVRVTDEFIDTPQQDWFFDGRETSDPAPPRGRMWLVLSGRSTFGEGQNDWEIVWDNVRVSEYPIGQPTRAIPRILEEFNNQALPDWIIYSEPPRSEVQIKHGQLALTKTKSFSYDPSIAAIHRTPIEIRPGYTWEIEADLVVSSGSPGLVGLMLAKPSFLHYATWDPVTSLDGRQLALASPDGTVRLWDLSQDRWLSLPNASDERQLELRHPGAVRSAQFSPDARFLATIGNVQGEVFVWDLSNGQRVLLDLPQTSGFTTCRFSPDSRFLALTGTRGIGLIRVGGWKWVASLLEERTLVALTFSPIGQRMAAISEGLGVLLWDLSDPTSAPSRILTDYSVSRIEFSPDGQLLAGTLENGYTRVWKVTTRQPACPPLHGRLGRFGSDGRQLLLIGAHGGGWLWDFSGMVSEELSVRPIVTVESAASTMDQRITAMLQGHLAVVRGPNPPIRILEHPLSLRRASFSADRRFLITETRDLRSWIWELDSGTLVSPPQPTRYDPAVGEYPEIELPSEPRDLKVLSRLAAVLSGQRFNGKGGLELVDPRGRERLWHEVRKEHPSEFAAGRDQQMRWHGRLATQGEKEREWDAAVFHWEQVLKLRGNPTEETLALIKSSGIQSLGAESRRAYARLAAQNEQAEFIIGYPRRSIIPPRPSWAVPEMLDLGPFYTQSLREDVAPAEQENSFGQLAGGIQDLGGIRFDVRGIINFEHTNRVSIPLHRCCRKIHFLHAAIREVIFAISGIYEVRYEDGQTERVELLSPIDLPPYRTSSFLRDAIVGVRRSSPALATTLAWAGANAEVESRNETLFLTRATWKLPEIHRDKIVQSLEIRVGEAAATPLVFAITTE